MEILKHPNPILKQISQPVKKFDKELTDFVIDLLDTMKHVKWGYAAGMSAIQVGKPLRLFIAQDEVYINPVVIWVPSNGQGAYHREGCYSLEDEKFDYPVHRPYAVKLRWQDLDGVFHEHRFNDKKAQVILHEMDHLDGKLCIDHAGK